MVLAAAVGAAATPAGAQARCGDAGGPRADGLFATVAPFEHGTPSRTHLFPAA